MGELQLLHHHHLHLHHGHHHVQQFVLPNVYQLVQQPVVLRRNIKKYSIMGWILALSAIGYYGYSGTLSKSISNSVHIYKLYFCTFFSTSCEWVDVMETGNLIRINRFKDK